MANAPLLPHTPLNAKQLRFIDEYVASGNATKAAKAAGYSQRSAAAQGCALLSEPKIRRAIDEKNANIANELGLTRAYVLKRLAAEAETSTSGAARVRALELIGRAHGLFAERIDHHATAELVFKLDMGKPRDEVMVLDAIEVAELGPGEDNDADEDDA